MSSILKALKKLEDQTKDKSPVRFQQQKDQQQDRNHLRMIDHLRTNKHFLVILAGLIFAAAVGITLNQKVRYSHSNVAVKKETRRQSPARFPDKKTVAATRVEKKSLSPKKIKMPERAKKEVKMRLAPGYTSRRVPQDVLGKKALPSKQAAKGKILEKGNEKHISYVKPGRFANIPVKRSSETEIKIQAIAWSKDPISRLAVINGLILREGETIDNVIVVNIDKDSVVFDGGGQKWKQWFGF